MSDPVDVTHCRAWCIVPARAEAVFAVLANPGRHPEFDGSGMLRGAVDPELLTSTGQVFRMNMHHKRVGDYTTENHVRILVVNEEISWNPSGGGRPPNGHWWGYDIRAIDDHACEVGLNYDWSEVADPEIKARIGSCNESNMQESLTQLQGLFSS